MPVNTKPIKSPLHPDGGTPVEEADMSLSELDTAYAPQEQVQETAETELRRGVRNGNTQADRKQNGKHRKQDR